MVASKTELESYPKNFARALLSIDEAGLFDWLIVIAVNTVHKLNLGFLFHSAESYLIVIQTPVEPAGVGYQHFFL